MFAQCWLTVVMPLEQSNTTTIIPVGYVLYWLVRWDASVLRWLLKSILLLLLGRKSKKSIGSCGELVNEARCVVEMHCYIVVRLWSYLRGIANEFFIELEISHFILLSLLSTFFCNLGLPSSVCCPWITSHYTTNGLWCPSSKYTHQYHHQSSGQVNGRQHKHIRAM